MSTEQPPARIIINTTYNPQEDSGFPEDDAFDAGLFPPSEEDDDDEYSLHRALPSNSYTWDNVRKYSLAITSRPDILLGLTPPPPATFFDDDNKRRQTPSNASSSVHGRKQSVFASNHQQQQQHLPNPRISPAVEPDGIPPPPPPPEDSSSSTSQASSPRTRRNTLLQSLNNQPQPEKSPLALLRQLTPTSPSEISSPMDSIKENRRKSMIGFEVDAHAHSLPPPPVEDATNHHVFVATSPNTPTQAQPMKPAKDQTPDVGRTTSLPLVPKSQKNTSNNNSSRHPEESDDITPLEQPILITTNRNQTTTVQPAAPNTIDRRRRNLSRTEQEMMNIIIQSKTLNNPNNNTAPAGVLESMAPPANTSTLSTGPSPSFEHMSSTVSSKGVTANPIEMFTLYKKAIGEDPSTITSTMKNDAASNCYTIPDLFSCIQLGVLLVFGHYSTDTCIDLYTVLPDGAVQLASPPSRRSLKLNPTTFTCSNVIQHPLFCSQIASSQLYSMFASYLQQTIVTIPFDIPTDLHPRSFGVSLLLFAATTQVSLVQSELTSHYQQSAAFFLSIALITQLGALPAPQPTAQNPNFLKSQEDVLFYASLITDHMDYNRIYRFYAAYLPTFANTAAKSISQQQHASFASLTAARQDQALGYGSVPQIEHQSGLLFYKVAPVADQAFLAYQQHFASCPHAEQLFLSKPSFLTPVDCYLVGFILWLRSAAQSFPPAMADVSWARQSGFGIKKDEQLALYWIYKSARLGDARSMNNLGLYYKKGIGLAKPDVQRAYHWLNKARTAQYVSLSAKTLSLLEKQLTIQNALDNPYTDPLYGQPAVSLGQNPDMQIDSWPTWIIDCETYANPAFDVRSPSSSATQPQRIQQQVELTARRTKDFPPLVQNDMSCKYNAGIILAMIPRLTQHHGSPSAQHTVLMSPPQPAAASNTSQLSDIVPHPATHVHQIATPAPPHNTTDIVRPTSQLPQLPNTPLPPLPPQQHKQPTQLSLTPSDEYGDRYPVAPTPTNRPAAFDRRTSIGSLSRPHSVGPPIQPIQLSEEEKQQLNFTKQQLQTEFVHTTPNHAPAGFTSSLLKTPIRPNTTRILNANPEDLNNSSAPRFHRYDSMSIDPVSAQLARQEYERELNQHRYLQQDHIPQQPQTPSHKAAQSTTLPAPMLIPDDEDPPPPPPPLPEDDLVPIQVQVKGGDQSNSVNVHVFDQRTGNVSQPPRQYSPTSQSRPSVVGMQTPSALVVTTPLFRPLTPANNSGPMSPANNSGADNYGRDSLTMHRPMTANTNNAHRNSISLSTGSRNQSDTMQPILVRPVQRLPAMSDQEWNETTRQHYKVILARMMNQTHDGYIVKLDHLNQLAELRVLYNISAKEHQEVYHYCKQLFDRRQKQHDTHITEILSTPAQRLKEAKKKQQTLKLAQYEEELKIHQRKVAMEQKQKQAELDILYKSADSPTTCLSCQSATANQIFMPCHHIVICSLCAKKKLDKCPVSHCRQNITLVQPVQKIGK